MKILKLRIGPRVLVYRFYNLLSCIWFIPFGFYKGPIFATGIVPHPLKPRTFRDLIMNKMIIPDNIFRAVVADKIAARGWVAERIGREILVPLYDICETAKQVCQNEYPYPYVVKTSHASGQCFFVRNNTERAQMHKTIVKWHEHEHNPKTEWAYRGIKRKFLVEKMLIDDQQTETIDIKLFCFFGEPVLIYRIVDRAEVTKKVFLTTEWQHIDLQYNIITEKKAPPKPENLSEILQMGARLAQGFDFIRVDLLIFRGKIFFSELTNFPEAGQQLFQPHDYDKFLLETYHRIRREKIKEARDDFHDSVCQDMINRLGKAQ